MRYYFKKFQVVAISFFLFINLAIAEVPCTDSQCNIVTVNKDGQLSLYQDLKSKPTLLGKGGSPSVSPDRSKVAFLKDHESKKESFSLSTPLVILDLNNLKDFEIDVGNIRKPQWSPDGKSILFAKRNNNNWTLYISPSGMSKPKPLIDDPVKNIDTIDFAWMPDSKSIVAHDFYKIYFISAAGKIQKEVNFATLGEVGKQIGGHSPSPFVPNPINSDQFAHFCEIKISKKIQDGFAKAFGNDDGPGSICLYDLKDNKESSLTPQIYNAHEPQWSADGEKIFFVGEQLEFAKGKPKKGKIGIFLIDIQSKHVEFLFPDREI
jgi:Tol biopolymer transport system component